MSERSAATITIGIVAGEASGDLLGAHLMRSLVAHMPHVSFAGIGGPEMRAAGMQVLFPMERLAVRGYVEVLRHYFEITGIRRRLARHFLRERPACFIGIDAPDFNLDLERRLKDAGIPTVHYVSPAIWAWRGRRIREIKRAVSKMLTLFPFEARLYQEAQVPVAYVGHPLADILWDFPGRQAIRERLHLPAGARVVALLPGSRVSELEQMADLFLAAACKVAEAVPGTRFVAPLVNRETQELFEAALDRVRGEKPAVTVLRGRAHEAMAAADVVLVASGTATLEAALLKRPMVITYRMPRISWWIMNRLRYQPYAGLPNILAGEFIVPELLQQQATPDNLAHAILNLLFDDAQRERLEARFGRILSELRQNTAQKVVEAVRSTLGGGAA